MQDREFIRMRLEEGANNREPERRPPWLLALATGLRRTVIPFGQSSRSATSPPVQLTVLPERGAWDGCSVAKDARDAASPCLVPRHDQMVERDRLAGKSEVRAATNSDLGNP